MSKNQRIGLVAAAIAVAVAAFLIASPGADDDEQTATRPSATAPQTESSTTETHTATETPEESTPEARPAPPKVERIALSGGVVKGGPRAIKAQTGDTVRIAVSSDGPDEIHIHGYDLTKIAAPGQPARFRFKAKIEGDFEIESHTAEHAGKEPLVARLQVAPG